MVFPAMSSNGWSGETAICSIVPRSFSRTTEKAVEMTTMTMRMKAMRPGTRKLALRSSGLYQTRVAASTGMRRSPRPRSARSRAVARTE